MTADSDTPVSARASLNDPAITSPLRPFNGARPDAPGWFHAALADLPERGFVDVEGARIETLTWGERGQPGLLMLHGNGAHADWYSFIAPFFARTYRVTAMSWSGMGGSEWRDVYSIDQFGREALAVAEATGLFDAPVKPIVIAHSFGGGVAIRLAAVSGERLQGTVVLDNVPRPPHLRWKGPPDRSDRPPPVYDSFTAALARFRLMPPQGCSNLYLVDHIARHSLKPVPGPQGGEGWSWRFDPRLWQKLDRSVVMESEHDLAAARCPMAFIWGEHSQLVPDEGIAFTRRFITPGTPMIAVPDADHHLMLDQPLATVAALRSVLSVWPQASRTGET